MTNQVDVQESGWMSDGIMLRGMLSGLGPRRGSWVQVWRKRYQVKEKFAMKGNEEVTFEVVLRGSLAVLDSRADELRAQLADVEVASQATRRLLSGYNAGNIGVPKEVTVEELNTCENQAAGLNMIADKSGGRIRLGEAVKKIHESNLTSAKVASLRTALHRYIKDSPEWVQESRGVYRRVGFAGNEKAEPGGLVRIHRADGEDEVYRVRLGPDGQIGLEDVENNAV